MENTATIQEESSHNDGLTIDQIRDKMVILENDFINKKNEYERNKKDYERKIIEIFRKNNNIIWVILATPDSGNYSTHIVGRFIDYELAVSKMKGVSTIGTIKYSYSVYAKHISEISDYEILNIISD